MVFQCWALLLCVSGIELSAFPASESPVVLAPQAQARTPGPGDAAAREDDPYYQFLLGRHLESTGDIENAIKAYERAARADPRSAEIPAELAALYARQDRPQESISAARAALKLDPGCFEAHRVLGTVLAELARPDDPSSLANPEAARNATEAIAHLETAARAPNRPPDPELQLLLGQLYVATHRFDQAVIVLEELVAQEGDIPQVVELLAGAYVATSRISDATSLLTRVSQADPRFYTRLAELYERQQSWKDAVSAYEKALKFFPTNSEIKTRQAVALLSIGGEQEAARARDLMAQVLKDRPTDARAVFLMAQAQRTLKDLDGAEQTARRLMELTPTSTTGPETLAQIYSDRHEPEKVISLLEPIVTQGTMRIPPRDLTPLQVALAFAYLEHGDADRAVVTFEAARKQAPSDPTLGLYLVQAQIEAGRAQAALDQIRVMRAGGFDDPRLGRLEADALRRSGQLDQGVEVLKKAIAARPDDPMGYLALAELYFGAQRYDDALRLLRDAGQRFPDNLEVLFKTGAALERSGQYAEAVEAFRRVIALDPLHALALNYLGYIMAERGERLDEAIGYIRRALAVEPGNRAYLDSLGWAYFKQNKLDLAEENLRPAAESHTRDSAIQEHYGDLLEKRGRYAEAIAAWERALTGDGEQVDKSAIEQKIRTAKGKIKPR